MSLMAQKYEKAYDHDKGECIFLEQDARKIKEAALEKLKEAGKEVKPAKAFKRRAEDELDDPWEPPTKRACTEFIEGRKLVNAVHDLRSAREAYEELRRTLGENHPLTLVSLSNVSSYLFNEQETPDAGTLAVEALVNIREALGDEHENTQAIMNNTAVVLDKCGRHEEAVYVHSLLLMCLHKRHGYFHKVVAAVSRRLALALHTLGEKERAAKVALGSLRVHSEMYGEGTSQLEQAEKDLKPLLASSPS